MRFVSGRFVSGLKLDLTANAIGVRRHFIARVFFQLENELNVVVVVAWRNVKMAMKDRLPRGATVIRKNIEARRIERCNNGLRYKLGGFDQIEELMIGNFEERRCMSVRNDEDVAVMNRIDVENCYRRLVPEENFSCRVTADNLAKFTLHRSCIAFMDRYIPKFRQKVKETNFFRLLLYTSFTIFSATYLENETHFTGAIMKRFTIISLCIGISILFLLLTGFQCGSSEMTSAKLYISQKNFDKADTALLREVQKNPQNGEAWYLYGRNKLEQGNIPAAIEALNKAEQTPTGKDFAADIQAARTYAWQVSINKGVNLYNRSNILQKDQPEAMKDSITWYRQAAVTAYRDAITASPDSAMNYQNLAIDQFALGDYDAEISTLKEGIARTKSASLEPLLIDAYSAKYSAINQKIQKAEAGGDKQGAAGLYKDALSTIAEARRLYPDNADLMALEIDLYVRSGKAEEAKPSIRTALQKDPGNKVYNYNLGVLLLQTDSLKEALPYFEKALEVDPNYEPALQNIAVSHMKLGDRIKKATQTSSSKIDPDKSYLEHFKKAAGYFQKLTEIKPDDANYWDYLASAYANANMVKDAKKALETSEAIRKKK